MGFGSKILLMIFIITFFLISFLCTHILIANTTFNAVEYNNVKGLNKVYPIKREEQDVFLMEKFRSLLGVNILLARTSASARSDDVRSPSPSPLPSRIVASEAPAPSPKLPAHTKHPHLPLHKYHHNLPPTQRRKQQEGNNARRIITAIVVSSVIGFILCALLFFWGFKKFRKQRKKTTNTVIIYSNESGLSGRSKHEVSSVKKVSSDPRPDLFYLDSLAAALDPEPFCLKQNPNSKDDNFNGSEELEKGTIGIVPDQDNDVFCDDVEEIMSAHEETESSQVGTNASNAMCDDVLIAEEAYSSDDESFHSVCNSHSSAMRLSIASHSSASEYSEIISPKGSEVSLNLSPTHLITETSALEPPQFQSSDLEDSTLPTGHPPPPPPPLPPPPMFAQDRRFPPSQSNCLSKTMTSDGLASSSPSNVSSSSKINSSSGSNKTTQNSASPSNSPMPPQGIPPPPFPPPFPKGNPSKCPSLPSQLFEYTHTGKDGATLPKLKPLHWDKVRAAPDRSTVWDKLRSSSFEFDEEMIESLFGYNLQNTMKNDDIKTKTPSPTKHVLEPKRLQNITILSKALNVTAEQVCVALRKGSGLSLQELEALAKMVPTKEEEIKLSDYKGSINELGSAEKFVKEILNIPFAFSRVKAMLYKETFDDELIHLRKSFFMLEEACKELRSSRLFLKLLEAVLKTGNRMNVGTIRGGAKAFKLDALLKLADVKGTDGKTTLLHFVVQEIIRSEGIRASESIMGKINQRSKGSNKQDKEEDYRRLGLDLVCGLSTELCNVKKTASLDTDVLANSVSNVSDGMMKVKHLVNEDLSSEEKDGNFVFCMKTFLKYSEKSLKELQEDENRVLQHVREITEYFHGDLSKDECNALRIFVIVRDFLGLLDHVCKELRSSRIPSSPNPLAPFR